EAVSDCSAHRIAHASSACQLRSTLQRTAQADTHRAAHALASGLALPVNTTERLTDTGGDLRRLRDDRQVANTQLRRHTSDLLGMMPAHRNGERNENGNRGCNRTGISVRTSPDCMRKRGWRLAARIAHWGC